MITIAKVLLKKVLRKKIEDAVEKKVEQKVVGASKSKTVRFGAALVVFSALEAQTGMVRAITPDEYEPLVIAFIGFMVVVFRWITERPLEDK